MKTASLYFIQHLVGLVRKTEHSVNVPKLTLGSEGMEAVLPWSHLGSEGGSAGGWLAPTRKWNDHKVAGA